jgi:hypothetical protein
MNIIVFLKINDNDKKIRVNDKLQTYSKNVAQLHIPVRNVTLGRINRACCLTAF